jgi:quercetin dioxygenase-like cupin family protein/catechol 2,3-dioxygenase-like lactoylglutathione lyase family enzyme
MTNTATPHSVLAPERQVSTDLENSRAWWFLETLAVLRNPPGAPRTPAVIELTIPPGGSPPRHVHEGLDDSFLVLEGEVVVRCGEQTTLGRPGTYLALPAGVPHTFRVTSPVPARLLLVHADDSFLNLIEAAGTPTTELRLPPPGQFDVDLDTLARLTTEHDSRIVGSSLGEGEAVAFAAANPSPIALGSVHHISVAVTDVRRSEEWYTRAFGLVRVDGEVDADGIGHVILASPTGGWLLTCTSAEAPGVDHIALTCRDRQTLVAWRDVLGERNVAPGSITDAPYGSGLVVRDPDGVEVELFTPAPTAA